MSINLKTPDLYTVGWIAVLRIERTAATALLDEEHEKPTNFVQNAKDDNSYSWGRMGKHNVVIASFEAGDSGTNPAAILAERMLSSLPHIRVGLLVGIGGGIPSARRDLRLGDVAVSQPKDRSGGVVQYDFVKANQGKMPEGKDFLGKPPGVLLEALSALQTQHDLKPSKMAKFLDDMISKHPKLAEPTHGQAAFVFPGANVDRLFKDDYVHQGGPDCRGCDAGQLVPARKPPIANQPKIHYGIIASGNTVVKDAVSRRKLIEHLSEDCICYEMEAAGLMNNFPCLVIRGICDYADSHKNDQWHPYAAAIAAAFAKELLDFVPQNELEKTKKAIEAVR
ncbi:hypothetical protein SLS58_007331 [Diplodia intermedia]|uniref:Nucleoside phosphorylase domain-containing protein n=1 Tax=Diplodia intermedia TaxID=856260 RepID=A0ABR3TKI2_9PEZI